MAERGLQRLSCGDLPILPLLNKDMSIIEQLQQSTIESLKTLYQADCTEKDFQVNQTKPEFEGDYTVVMFSLVKLLKQSPDEIGNRLGSHLTSTYPSFSRVTTSSKGS